MSSKLKDFLTNLRACKTTKEEKELILKEKASIRQSFQKNEHAFRPRNLVKLIFINLQGVDTEFGQVESINITCRGSFIEKKVGYLSMAVFLHEKSEMLMMATNRISMDLDHPNPFVRCLAISAFASISDSEMARSISPKLRALITQTPMAQLPASYIQSGYFNHNPANTISGLLTTDDSYKTLLVRKKALQAALRVIKKCPDLASEYVSIIQAIFKEKDHGLLLSAIPLAEEVYLVLAQNFAGLDERLLGTRTAPHPKPSQGVVESRERKALDDLHQTVPFIVEKIRSLMTHIDPDYAVRGVNDPFLLISSIRCLREMFEAAERYGVGISPRLSQIVMDTIGFVIATNKPSKNTINAVMYELARLSLIFRENDEQIACAFMILNQLIEVKDNTPNYKFVALNLIKNFKYLNAKTLEMLLPHTELILGILENAEDVSLKTLALQVLPHVSSEQNVFRVLDCMKSILLKHSGKENVQGELYQAVVRNVFYLLENKMRSSPSKRVEESIKILLLMKQDLNEDSLSSLINLIVGDERLQTQVLSRLWGLFGDNWRAVGLFKVTTYLLGEFSELFAPSSGSAFNTDDVLAFYSNIAPKITDPSCKAFLLNSAAKILGKGYDRARIGNYMSIFETFRSDQDIDIQNRAFEYTIMLSSSDISDTQRKELFSTLPLFTGKERDFDSPSKPTPSFENILDIDVSQPRMNGVKANNFSDINLLNLLDQKPQPQANGDLDKLTTVFPNKLVILKDLEFHLEAEYVQDGPSFRGNLRVTNEASQSLYNVVVQLAGLQNATVEFKTTKIGVLNSRADRAFEFRANLLDPTLQEARFKFSIRYFFSNTNFSEDFREVKEGAFVLSLAKHPSQGEPVKSSDLDIFSYLGAGVTLPQHAPSPKKDDLLDFDFV
jgi:AP-1 complex subunit gamma-1